MQGHGDGTHGVAPKAPGPGLSARGRWTASRRSARSWISSSTRDLVAVRTRSTSVGPNSRWSPPSSSARRRFSISTSGSRAGTPTHYITIGLNEDLDAAAKQALRSMIVWLVEMKGWKPTEACVFCSLACDLHVTQLVDGNKGIHAMVRRDLLS